MGFQHGPQRYAESASVRVPRSRPPYVSAFGHEEPDPLPQVARGLGGRSVYVRHPRDRSESLMHPGQKTETLIVNSTAVAVDDLLF